MCIILSPVHFFVINNHCWPDITPQAINLVFCYWLYVLIISCARFRVIPHSIVAWMSRKSLLETDNISESRCSYLKFCHWYIYLWHHDILSFTSTLVYIINFNHHISFYLLQTIVHLIHFLKTIVHLIHFLCHSIVLHIQIYHIWLDLYRTVIQSYCHFFKSISSLEINNLGMSLNKVWFYMYNYLSFEVGPMDSWVLFNSLSLYLMFIKVKRYNVVSE